jgi:BirA family biotin operon repressor/biotin-[acetyl-CoA-carboxylase] ligase
MDQSTNSNESVSSTGFGSAGQTKAMMSTPFDAEKIRGELAHDTLTRLSQLTVLEAVDSTNSVLSALARDQLHAHAVLADQQTGGRGRGQRSWHSPPGGNIYLSLGWCFDSLQFPLSTLPLVVAIAICRALERAGLEGHGIKWPNDILSNNKKLAGILVEMQSAGTGPALAVMGVGLNVYMPEANTLQTQEIIDRPWTDLSSELGEQVNSVNRDELVAILLDELFLTLAVFESGGFETLRPEWVKRDLLQGSEIRLEHADGLLNGVVKGVNRDGGLLLYSDDRGIEIFHSGEVSIPRD